MAWIIGDYVMKMHLPDNNFFVKGLVRLDKNKNYYGEEQFCQVIYSMPQNNALTTIITGGLDVYIPCKESFWSSQPRYIQLNSGYPGSNNKLYGIINTINNWQLEKVDFRDKVIFNYSSTNCASLRTELYEYEHLSKWIKSFKGGKVSILEHNKGTSELKKNGYISIKVNIDKQKLLAQII